MALTHPQFMIQSAEPDLYELRAQLLALFRQCEDDLVCASQMRADYEMRLQQANELHRTSEHRMSVIRAMLDLEFPDWRGDRD